MTCSDHTILDGEALRRAPLRLLDLESLCSVRSDQSDRLYQVRPGCRSHLSIYLSLYTAIRPRGHSRQGSAASVSIRQEKEEL